MTDAEPSPDVVEQIGAALRLVLDEHSSSVCRGAPWDAGVLQDRLARAVLAAIGPAIRAEERRKVVADIATIMGDFVENWPDHKKASTSIALIAKTLKASREQVLEARATISKLVMCARTSGGTAGPDQGLMEACEDGEMWLAKYESQP